MSVKLILTKQGEQSLKKRIQQSSTTNQGLTLKKSHSEFFTIKNSDVDTNQNSSHQKSLEQPVFYSMNTEQISFKISNKNDHHRHHLAHKDGGMTCDDPKQIDKLRSVGKQMIKLIGRKILSGQFNLTKISIPIKSCYPKTALYNSVKGYSIFPYFMKSASQCTDPVERFKIVLSCLVAQPYYLNMFLKPLNPIIGQTLQASLPDGTKIYAQQISHHPPISYFLIYGPNQSYRFSGYYDIQVSPSINSLTIRNKGKRRFQFKDGSVIETTYATNQFNGTFFGTSRVQELNNFVIEDKMNNLKCLIEFGKAKKKPSDHFTSEILQKNIPIGFVEGTCLGYINIDNKRYWDGRDLKDFELIYEKTQKRLPSDWQKRQDLQMLKQGDIEVAQKYKEQLQQKQRGDAKLRKKYKKIEQKQIKE